ncbi:MAG: hypothetical protein JWR63_4100 [Conexibacter sp.]|nr:hypothetical protein [Conexibacter sp.]
MRTGAGTLATATIVAGALVATPAAQASDKGLIRTVVRYENRVEPLAAKWAKADKALSTAPDTNAASAATGAFRGGLHAYKVALVPIKTQTTTAAAGKKQMLTAIREFDLGLVQYQKLLDKVNAGADKSSLKSTFITLNKRIKAAADDEVAALKLLKKV